MAKRSFVQIRNQLDQELDNFFSNKQSLLDDPIHCVSRELIPQDAELISFIVAGLSYGRVEQIKKSSFDLLKRLSQLGIEEDGAGLAHFLRSTSEKEISSQLHESLKGWRHRLNTASDMLEVICALQRILKGHKSMCAFFQKNQHLKEPQISLHQFSNEFNARATPSKSLKRRTTQKWAGTGLSWFAPTPNDNGTCKRMLMWLRWMIRHDQIDLGLWQLDSMLDENYARPMSSALFIPVDTHLQKWAFANKVTSLKSPSWKMVLQVSQFFKEVNSEDPLKYDFMLCHQGMKSFRARADA